MATAIILRSSQAKFDFSTNGLIANFVNQSLDATEISWDFGDGSTALNFNTIVVIGITSSLAYSGIPGNVYIPREDGYLSKDSVICVAHMTAIDKMRFGKRVTKISDLILDQVEFGISLVLDLK